MTTAAPVLVRTYRGDGSVHFNSSGTMGKGAHALPPISSYSFAAILRSADSPEFQHAIDGIAEICAKNRMSLADEYSSHLPPLGEITAASSAAARPHALRPGMKRVLTSVPEGSSGSSEGSRKSKKRTSGLFSFRRKEPAQIPPMKSMRIGSMGRTIPVNGTTAMATHVDLPADSESATQKSSDAIEAHPQPVAARRTSAASSSLQRLLGQTSRIDEANS